jgi:hypothetical protein
MNTARLAIVIAVLSTSCAKAHWVHPAKSQSEFDDDLATCRSESGMTSVRGGANLGDAVQTQDRCLLDKGWRKAR